MRLDDPLVLAAGAYRLRIAPAAGARITALTWQSGGRWHDLVAPWSGATEFDAHDWPKAGAFPLAPFNNKLAGACFHWHGREVRLAPAPGQTHALHGFAHRAPWSVVRATDSEAVLQHVHPAGAEGWPWHFALTMTIAVDALGVAVDLALRNTDDVPMPAAIGWHPFHPLPAEPLRPREIRLQAGSREDLGPDGLRRLQPREAATLDAHRCVLLTPGTQVFTPWDGSLTLPLAHDADLRVRSTGAPHLLCHLPADLRHVCLEPITALPGALDHYEPPWRDTLALPPGGTRRLSWHCSAAPAS